MSTSRPPLERLYIEAVGGVAGDMLLAALLDLGADREAVRAAVASLGEPGLELEIEEVALLGERALRVRSLPAAPEPHGRHLDEVLAIIDRGALGERARATARRIFEVLAEAEAESHGEDRDHVHLHEVGELDSILDVVGIAVAFDSLGSPAAACGTLPSGRGQVASAHGVLELPAPAVRAVARRAGLTLVDVAVTGETVTPTGAAALAVLCAERGVPLVGRGDRVGVGAGTRRLADRPNVVRAHGWIA